MEHITNQKITVSCQIVFDTQTYFCLKQVHISFHILGACVMGLYVSFPIPGLANGLFSTAEGVDTFTGPGLEDCEGTRFVSSAFSRCGFPL